MKIIPRLRSQIESARMSKRGGGIRGCYPTAAERGRESVCVCVDARGNARQGVGIQSVLGPRGSNGTVVSS